MAPDKGMIGPSMGGRGAWTRIAAVAGVLLAAIVAARAVGRVAAGAPLVLSGSHTTSYRSKHLAAGAVIDARQAIFAAGPGNRYPITLGGAEGVCFAGGRVVGGYDRTWSWDRMHDLNNAALAFENRRFTVDGLRADNVTDGIRPRPGGAFTIRNVWLSYIRDDCIENDHLEEGLVESSLFDGCYVAFSARPSPAKVRSGWDGSAKIWTIRDSLIRLEAMPGPRDGSPDDRGHGGFFKWHRWKEPGRSLSPKLALHRNVFLAESAGQESGKRLGVPPGRLASCSDNVVVWLGAGDFPGALPAECFRVTTERRVWDEAVAAWRRRHGVAGAGGAGAPGAAACGLPAR